MNRELIQYLSSKRELLVSEATAEQRIKELAREIVAQYAREGVSPQQIIILGILKGGAPFASGLQTELYRLGWDVKIDYLPASSYGNGKASSGNVQFNFSDKLKSNLRDKHVLVAEDIADTGHTLSELVKTLLGRIHAQSVKVAVEFDKPAGRTHQVSLDFVGQEIPNVWVDGRGIDTAEEGRGNPNLMRVISSAEYLFKMAVLRDVLKKTLQSQDPGTEDPAA